AGEGAVALRRDDQGVSARRRPRAAAGRMTEPPKRPPLQLPPLPLHPGREAFSHRTRSVLLVILIAVFVALVVGGVLLARSSSKPRVVTIPKADRNATAALIRAAEEVHFRPPHAGNAGEIEDQPAAAAKILTKG